MDGYILLLAIGAMIIFGHIMGKLFDKIKLPEVTGFIIAGIIINLLFRFVFKQEDALHEAVDAFQLVITIALSFVSFIIGTKLWKHKVKELSKGIFPVLILQLIFVISFTSLGFLIFKDIKFALLIGAISAATAPAPIIEITNKYSSRGPLTETLTAIVGFDNIIGLIYFFIIAAIVPQIGTQSFEMTPVLHAILGSLIAVGIGLVLGVALALFDKQAFSKYRGHEKHDSYLIVSVGIIILAAIGSHVLTNYLPVSMQVSPFITTLILGMVFTNLTDRDTYEYETVVIGEFIPPLITAFFVIAGMELDVLQLFSPIGLYAVIYVITHVGGKYLGAYLGTRINPKCNEQVKNHLPKAVLTQGGFEIALAMLAAEMLGSQEIKLIVLTAVLMFEFFAPLFLTKALHDANEVSFVPIEASPKKQAA
ncbi:MAG TPA: hypothetical protein GX742_03610 [Acholeplasmataceae bacterium]|nr:hypothetical protein [Acholeplasmataceae bacterium]